MLDKTVIILRLMSVIIGAYKFKSFRWPFFSIKIKRYDLFRNLTLNSIFFQFYFIRWNQIVYYIDLLKLMSVKCEFIWMYIWLATTRGVVIAIAWTNISLQ